ncbi:MAG: 30S ribosomal protein S13 [Thermoplasmata archaeon]
MRTAPKNAKETAPAAETEATPAKPATRKERPSGKAKEAPAKGKRATGAAAAKDDAPVSDNPNFRYIVRVANTDLDGRRPTALALTGVEGVGLRIAEATCQLAGIDPRGLIGDLPESVVETIEATLADLPKRLPPWMTNQPREFSAGAVAHYIGPDLETARRDAINQMKMIRSYRGVRHERGQKVRGQRTRSNGRTGMAAGVLKKAAKEAAQAKAKEGGTSAKKE